MSLVSVGKESNFLPTRDSQHAQVARTGVTQTTNSVCEARCDIQSGLGPRQVEGSGVGVLWGEVAGRRDKAVAGHLQSLQVMSRSKQ